MLTRGLVGSVLVLLGGLVTSTLPPSARVLTSDLLPALRGAEAGRMAALSVVMLGLGLLSAAWLRLCRDVSRAGDSDDAVGLVRHAALLWSAPLLLAPPLFSRDGWSYAAQGMLTHVGRSPYDHGPGVLTGPIVEAVDPRWMFTTTPYGPLPLMYGDAFAGLTGNPWLLVIAHRGMAMAGLVLLAWAVPRLARWAGADPGLPTAIAVASPFMLANGVGGLHNDLLMVGLMSAALVLAVERGWVVGAAVGGLAAAVKLPGGLVCIAVALVALPVACSMVERLRRLAAVGVVSVAVLGGLGVVWRLGVGWVGALGVPGTINTPLSLPTVVGGLLDWSVGRWLGLDDATFLDTFRAVATVAALVLAVVVALRWETGSRHAALKAVALLTGGLVVLSPVVHLWYLMWVLPFLAALRLPRVGAVLVLGGSVVFGLVAPLDSSLHGAYLAIVMGCAYAAMLAGVLLLTRAARERLHRISDSHRGRDGAGDLTERDAPTGGARR